MQPDRVRIPLDELIHIYAVNGWRSLDTFLLSIDKYGYIFFSPPPFLSFLGSGELSLLFSHNNEERVAYNLLYFGI
jgi:hypothetical protein